MRNKSSRARKNGLSYHFVLHLYRDGRKVFDNEGAQVLEAIDKYHSLSGAAEKIGRSYFFVCTQLRHMRNILHRPVTATWKGGSKRKAIGGGGATLTPFARKLVRDFRLKEVELEHFLITGKNKT